MGGGLLITAPSCISWRGAGPRESEGLGVALRGSVHTELSPRWPPTRGRSPRPQSTFGLGLSPVFLSGSRVGSSQGRSDPSCPTPSGNRGASRTRTPAHANPLIYIPSHLVAPCAWRLRCPSDPSPGTPRARPRPIACRVRAGGPGRRLALHTPLRTSFPGSEEGLGAPGHPGRGCPRHLLSVPACLRLTGMSTSPGLRTLNPHTPGRGCREL